MKNYFLLAYLKNKKSNVFWSKYEEILTKNYQAYIKNNKIGYKKVDFLPKKDLKQHIFINDGY